MPRAGRILRTVPVLAGRTVLAALLGILLIGGSGCAVLPVRDDGDSSLFPRLAGRSWVAVEPPRTVGPADLYEEIDGEAELFLPFDFRELTAAILAPAGNETAQVRLELFRHGTPRDAFGIYSQHRFPGQERMRVGTSEAIVSATSLDFFQGTRFVRIRAVSRKISRADLEGLGRVLSGLLPGTGDPPPETEALRVPGQVDGSIVFHRRAILGYEALAPGYESKYAVPGMSGTLILITSEDAGPPSRFRENLFRHLPGFARIGKDLFRADLPSGTLWLLSRDRYHLGFAGKATRAHAEAVLTDLDRNIDIRW